MTIRLISRLACLMFSLWIVPLPLHAGASNKTGNPFANNGNFYSYDGTYTGVLRGENLTGITQFTTSSSNSISTSAGVTMLYYNGQPYSSGMFVVINPSTLTINGLLSQTASSYGDALAGGGNFSGTLGMSPPSQTFNASGYIQPAADWVPFSISGARIQN
jgi:hypothetical protein